MGNTIHLAGVSGGAGQAWPSWINLGAQAKVS